MELGKSLNLDGKAAYQPTDTYAHPIAASFAAAIGYDAEGKQVSGDTPMSGDHNPTAAPPFRSGAR